MRTLVFIFGFFFSLLFSSEESHAKTGEIFIVNGTVVGHKVTSSHFSSNYKSCFNLIDFIDNNSEEDYFIEDSIDVSDKTEVSLRIYSKNNWHSNFYTSLEPIFITNNFEFISYSLGTSRPIYLVIRVLRI
jgi:hypothetical protein